MATKKSFEDMVADGIEKAAVKREITKRYTASEHYRTDMIGDATRKRVGALIAKSKLVDLAAHVELKRLAIDATPVPEPVKVDAKTNGVAPAATA